MMPSKKEKEEVVEESVFSEEDFRNFELELNKQ